MTESSIVESLRRIIDPHTGRDLISLGAVKDVKLNGGTASIKIELEPPATPERSRLKDEVNRLVSSLEGIKDVRVELEIRLVSSPQPSAGPSRPERKPLLMKTVIPVASGKGGVGKSTVSANLAVALANLGAKVGLMDADVYGPSIPMIMGVKEHPRVEGERIIPPVAHGVKIISMGFFLPEGDAVIWRGPMLHKTVDEFLGKVDWGELDYLIVDLPPGTGDIQLSLCQKIPLTGAVIVSTPQDVAYKVAEKAIVMFRKLKTPILGLIENMSGYVCGECGHHDEIFGKGGAKRYSERLGIPFLGEIPLATSIRITSDEGRPIVLESPDSPSARTFLDIAKRLIDRIRAPAGTEKVPEGPRPEKVSQPVKEKIEIIWKDGHRSTYSGYDLRVACSCAQCVDETSGVRRLKPGIINKDVYPLSIVPIGRYALKFDWSDGHNTGIYTFEHLRSLCGCAECLEQKTKA